jgi:hypothetical protein
VEKHEPSGAKALDGERRREFDGNAEGFEHIGSAAAGGDGAIAVLGDVRPCGSGHQRRTGRDVECKRTAAACSNNIDELGAFFVVKWHGGRTLAHHLNEAGEFGGLFAAGGEDSDERSNFDLGHFASENFSEDLGGLLAGHSRAIFSEGLEEVFDRGHTL